MLICIVLYCIVLYCIVLYCIVLYCIVCIRTSYLHCTHASVLGPSISHLYGIVLHLLWMGTLSSSHCLVMSFICCYMYQQTISSISQHSPDSFRRSVLLVINATDFRVLFSATIPDGYVFGKSYKLRVFVSLQSVQGAYIAHYVAVQSKLYSAFQLKTNNTVLVERYNVGGKVQYW